RRQFPRSINLARSLVDQLTIAVQEKRSEELDLQPRELVLRDDDDSFWLADPRPWATSSREALHLGENQRTGAELPSGSKQAWILGRWAGEQGRQVHLPDQRYRLLQTPIGFLRTIELEMRRAQPVKRLGFLVRSPSVPGSCKGSLKMIDRASAGAVD